MAKQTISFTIEEEQLAQLDALVEKVRLNRSILLGLLIDIGMPQIEHPQASAERGPRYAAAQVFAALRCGISPGPDENQVEA